MCNLKGERIGVFSFTVPPFSFSPGGTQEILSFSRGTRLWMAQNVASISI